MDDISLLSAKYISQRRLCVDLEGETVMNRRHVQLFGVNRVSVIVLNDADWDVL